MTEKSYQSSSLPTYARKELRELVRSQLRALLEEGDFKGAKAILHPVQEADIAEAIEGLPETMQVIAFRLLSKDEAIAVYEISRLQRSAVPLRKIQTPRSPRYCRQNVPGRSR